MQSSLYRLQGGVGRQLSQTFSKADTLHERRALQIQQLVLLGALWIVMHPYLGIIHDARLYLVQAMKGLEPGQLSNDLYFAYGSQDSFTTFSPFYRPLIVLLGPAAAHFVAAALGQALWFASVLFLLRTIFADSRTFVTAAAAVFVLGPTYGGHSVFSYGEPFATPRIFAEALVLAALALGIRKQFTLTFCFLVVASGLHPLMTLPGIAVLAFLAAFREQRIWVVLGIGIASCGALAAFDVEPFARVFLRFDDAWLDIVRQRCSFAFVTLWTWLDFVDLCSVITLFAMAWRLAKAAERGLIKAVVFTAASGVVATVLGGDIAGNVLVVNLQPWRALWIATLIANAWVGVSLLRLPKSRISREFVLMALAYGPAARLVGAMDFASPILLLLAGSMFLWEEVTLRPVPSVLRVAARIVAVSLGGVLVSFTAIKTIGDASWKDLVAVSTCTAVFIAAMALLVASRGQFRAPVLVGSVLVVIAIAVADRRENWTLFVEDPHIPGDLASFVSETGELYWELGIELLWIKMKKPSYYSCLQGTGAMFYAGTALEYQRRSMALSSLNTHDFADGSSLCARKALPEQDGPAVREQLVSSCRALPELDTVILSQPVLGAMHTSWRSPVSKPYSEGHTPEQIVFYKYSCSHLR